MASKKRSALIIECKDADDPGSEGQFIKHMLDLMRIPNCYRKARTRDEFLGLLHSEALQADLIHITTHGEYKEVESRKRAKFTGFWTPQGVATLKNIEAASVDLLGKVVVSTACFSDQKHAREKFKEATGCSHYIAPVKDPHFHNAPLMCHIFYHKYLVLGRSVGTAFSEYDERYKNPHDFRII